MEYTCSKNRHCQGTLWGQNLRNADSPRLCSSGLLGDYYLWDDFENAHVEDYYDALQHPSPDLHDSGRPIMCAYLTCIKVQEVK